MRWHWIVALASLSLGCSSEDAAGGTGGGAGSAGSGGQAGGGGACTSASAPFGTDAAQGHSFPDLEVVACDGTRVTLDSLRCSAQITLISIGAGWCQPCKDETPLLQAARDKLQSQGVEIVQIMFQDAQANPATTLFCETWRDAYQLTLPLFVDPAVKTLAYFDSAKVPLNLIVDRDGRVLWSEVGVIPQDLEQTLVSYLPK